MWKMSDVLTFRQPQITIHSLRVFPLLYLASPFSLYPEGPEMAFVQACRLSAKLIRNGVKIYSPIAHTYPISVHGDIDKFDHSIWIPFDESMMRVSTALLVAEMDGWKESKGVKIEIDIFARDGKPIYYINPNSLAIRQ